MDFRWELWNEPGMDKKSPTNTGMKSELFRWTNATFIGIHLARRYCQDSHAINFLPDIAVEEEAIKELQDVCHFPDEYLRLDWRPDETKILRVTVCHAKEVYPDPMPPAAKDYVFGIYWEKVQPFDWVSGKLRLVVIPLANLKTGEVFGTPYSTETRRLILEYIQRENGVAIFFDNLRSLPVPTFDLHEKESDDFVKRWQMDEVVGVLTFVEGGSPTDPQINLQVNVSTIEYNENIVEITNDMVPSGVYVGDKVTVHRNGTISLAEKTSIHREAMNAWRWLLSDAVIDIVLEFCGLDNVIVPQIGDEVRVTDNSILLREYYGGIKDLGCPQNLNNILGKAGIVTGIFEDGTCEVNFDNHKSFIPSPALFPHLRYKALTRWKKKETKI